MIGWIIIGHLRFGSVPFQSALFNSTTLPLLAHQQRKRPFHVCSDGECYDPSAQLLDTYLSDTRQAYSRVLSDRGPTK